MLIISRINAWTAIRADQTKTSKKQVLFFSRVPINSANTMIGNIIVNHPRSLMNLGKIKSKVNNCIPKRILTMIHLISVFIIYRAFTTSF